MTNRQATNTLILDLPTELWQCILALLPHKSLWNLHQVARRPQQEVNMALVTRLKWSEADLTLAMPEISQRPWLINLLVINNQLANVKTFLSLANLVRNFLALEPNQRTIENAGPLMQACGTSNLSHFQPKVKTLTETTLYCLLNQNLIKQMDFTTCGNIHLIDLTDITLDKNTFFSLYQAGRRDFSYCHLEFHYDFSGKFLSIREAIDLTGASLNSLAFRTIYNTGVRNFQQSKFQLCLEDALLLNFDEVNFAGAEAQYDDNLLQRLIKLFENIISKNETGTNTRVSQFYKCEDSAEARLCVLKAARECLAACQTCENNLIDLIPKLQRMLNNTAPLKEMLRNILICTAPSEAITPLRGSTATTTSAFVRIMG